MYKAKISIGDFKAGEIVPDKTAEAWAKMYKVSPVEKVEDEKKVEPIKEVEPEPKEEPKEEVKKKSKRHK